DVTAGHAGQLDHPVVLREGHHRHAVVIQDDELCEVTPKSIRLRKKILDEGERTRAAKKAKN
ncbi:hypothetical protein, partial [Pseudomonas fluorescens]|uniref:hypothetical protein n=1 Tax=Pseudomonas fluorescens TaxID=294 RepID=UPI003CFD2B16